MERRYERILQFFDGMISIESQSALVSFYLNNVHKIIPADLGVSHFKVKNGLPFCLECPDYISPTVDDFHSHYNALCPVKYKSLEDTLQKVDWQDFAETEFQKEYNDPLGITYSLCCAYIDFDTGTPYVFLMNRDKGDRPFSEDEKKSLGHIISCFQNLYQKMGRDRTEILRKIRSLEEFSGHERLSSREMEICLCLLKGIPSRDIADMFRISPRTVDAHCAHIYGKLLLHGRKELIRTINEL